jgi:hypothetical protein
MALAADNRGQVDEFYRQALAAGGKDTGVPGIRAHYHANYYAAFVIGPDGPQRGGGLPSPGSLRILP